MPSKPTKTSRDIPAETIINNSPKLKKLFSGAVRKGAIDPNELGELLSEMELEPSQINEVMGYIELSGIEFAADEDDNDGEDDSFDSQSADDGPSAKDIEDIENDDEGEYGDNSEEVNKELDKIDDSVRLYLKEIGQIDLLTAEEEIVIAKKIQTGLKAKAKLEKAEEKGTALTEEQRAKLLKQIAVGQENKDKLIKANLRLVVSVAKRYLGRGLPLMDLVQEGNAGLIKATEKFDPKKGYKFSTYATWWIRQAVTRSVADQARTIRIPVHMVENINKVVRTSRQLMQTIGHEPTPQELADEMHLPVAKINEMLKLALEPVPLDAPVGENDDGRIGDFIADKSVDDPSEVAHRSLMHTSIVEALDMLSPRERKVLELRYGLVDGRPRTLEEVGKEFNITRERIRQIEMKAIRKLRSPSRRKKLEDFVH